MSSPAMFAVLPPALRAVAADHEAKARAAEDAAAEAAREALAAFDPAPPALTKARGVTEKARTAVDAARTRLRDAEHALGQAAATEAQLAHELGETHRRLRRTSVAPWRLAHALATLRAALEAHEGAQMTTADAAARLVYLPALRTLHAVQCGDADAPADLEAFVATVQVDAQNAHETARREHDAARAAALADRRRALLLGAST